MPENVHLFATLNDTEDNAVHDRQITRFYGRLIAHATSEIFFVVTCSL